LWYNRTIVFLVVSALAALAALLAPACQAPPVVPLAELAREVPADPVPVALPSARPLLALAINSPDRLLARLSALLPMANRLAELDQAVAMLQSLPRFSSLYLEVEELSLQVPADPDSTLPVPGAFSAFLLAAPQSGDRVEPALSAWQAFLGRLWPEMGQGGSGCGVQGGRVWCRLDMLALTGDHAVQSAKCKMQSAKWPRTAGSTTIDHPPSHEASAGLRRPSAFAGRFGGTSSTITQDSRSSRSCLGAPTARLELRSSLAPPPRGEANPSVVASPPHGQTEGLGPSPELLARAEAAAKAAPGTLRLSLGLRELVRVGERFVSVPLFWALVPEELLALEEISLTISESPDRVELSVAGNDSALLAGVSAVLSASAVPVPLPAGCPFMAVTAVEELDSRLEALEKTWGGKYGPVSSFLLTKLQDKTWQSQLPELASGLIGAAQIGELEAADPLSGLVYFLQPEDGKAFEARLEYVFSGRSYGLEAETLPSGELLRKASQKRKNRPDLERLAWFLRGDTVYLAGRTALLKKLAAEMAEVGQPEQKPGLLAGAGGQEGWRPEAGGRRKDGEKLCESNGLCLPAVELGTGQKVRVRISPQGLAQRLKVPETAGMAETFAYGVIKTALMELQTPLGVELVDQSRGTRNTLVLGVDHLQGAIDLLLTKLAPVMKFVSRPSS
jgi:hypothetical protein